MSITEPIDRKHVENMSDVQRNKMYEWAAGRVFKVWSRELKSYVYDDAVDLPTAYANTVDMPALQLEFHVVPR